MNGIDWNSTDVEDVVFLRDISVTSRVVGLTGVAATSVTARYFKPGMTAHGTLALTALGSLGAAHVDGGWFEISATAMPGHYRLCISDTMAASVAGANPYVDLALTGTAFDAVNKKWDLLQPLSAATVPSDVRFINGTTAVGAGGYFGADVIRAGGTAVAATAGYLDVQLARVGNTAVVGTAGYLDVNVQRIRGTTAVATAGVVDANAITLGTAAATSVQTAALAAQTQYGAATHAHMTAAPNAVNPTRDEAIVWMYQRHRNRQITNATSVIQYNGSNVAISTRTLAGDTATDTANQFS